MENAAGGLAHVEVYATSRAEGQGGSSYKTPWLPLGFMRQLLPNAREFRNQPQALGMVSLGLSEVREGRKG